MKGYLEDVQREVPGVQDLESAEGGEGAVGDGADVVTLQADVPEVWHHLPRVAAGGRQLVMGDVQHSVGGGM